MDKRKIIRIALFCLLAAVFCAAGWQLIKVRLEYRENEQIYSDAADQFLIYTPETTPPAATTPAPVPTTTAATTPVVADTTAATSISADVSISTAESTEITPLATSAEPPATTTEITTTAPVTTTAAPIPTSPNFVPNWAAMKAANSDIVAWIWQSGTTINYPVLKSDTNEEYLYTTYNGIYSRFGSIFLDRRSSLDAPNPVIYGHNAGNGMMFASLVQYQNWNYFHQNRYFYILTEEGTQKYAIFSAYKVKTSSDTYTFRFDSAESYGAYIQKILLRSAYNMGVSVSETDEIVTLSTCTNTGEDDRYVIHAKRIEG